MLKVARLGGRHVCPPALGVEDVARVLEGLELDRRRAEELYRLSRGSPGALIGLVLRAGPDTAALAPVARQVLNLLSTGPQLVSALAERVGLSDHRLLDQVEPMIDQGLVTSSADGAWLMDARAET
jgi:hypothetical protein